VRRVPTKHLKPVSLLLLCELLWILRLEVSGERLDKLLGLGQATFGDRNIHAGCSDSVPSSDGAADLFQLLCGLFLV
jgi:hypothetical protein